MVSLVLLGGGNENAFFLLIFFILKNCIKVVSHFVMIRFVGPFCLIFQKFIALLIASD